MGRFNFFSTTLLDGLRMVLQVSVKQYRELDFHLENLATSLSIHRHIWNIPGVMQHPQHRHTIISRNIKQDVAR
jgi:hypothetical protein